MRAMLSVRPKCSHRCVSLNESPLKPVQILKHATGISTEQTSMRKKWFKHIAIETVQERLLICSAQLDENARMRGPCPNDHWKQKALTTHAPLIKGWQAIFHPLD